MAPSSTTSPTHRGKARGARHRRLPRPSPHSSAKLLQPLLSARGMARHGRPAARLTYLPDTLVDVRIDQRMAGISINADRVEAHLYLLDLLLEQTAQQDDAAV